MMKLGPICSAGRLPTNAQHTDMVPGIFPLHGVGGVRVSFARYYYKLVVTGTLPHFDDSQ